MLTEEDKASILNIMEIGKSHYISMMVSNPHKFNMEDVIIRRNYIDNLISEVQKKFNRG